MVSQEMKLVPCKIARGAFSGERIVEIELKNFQYRGVAPVAYCFTVKGERLDEVTPMRDAPMKGRVRVVLVRGAAGTPLTVATPDGGVRAINPVAAKELEAASVPV